MIDRNAFPKELTALQNWVCWRLEPDKKAEGRTTKVPYSPKTALKASSNKPDTWGTLDEALLFMDKYTLFSPKNPALWVSTLITASTSTAS